MSGKRSNWMGVFFFFQGYLFGAGLTLLYSASRVHRRDAPLSPLSTSVVPVCDLRTLPEAKGLIGLDTVLVRTS